ncbi:MAG: extracellular solute-binding protein [Pseudolabrys sp.]
MMRLLHHIAILFIGVIVIAGSARAQNMQELYEKAKAEKELIIYGGGPTSLYDVPARAFEAKYPGIKVTIHSGFSNAHDEKINQQLRTKTLDADLAILQTVQDFIRWKKEGVLARFKPPAWDAIDKSFKDKDGDYVGVFVTSVSYSYNKDLVKPADAPKSARDFLKAEFKGKMVSCYPHDDDITLYLFYTLVDHYGWDWMNKYLANGAQFIQGHLGVSRGLASGEYTVSVDSNPNLSLREQRAGKPVEISFSKIDPTPVWAQTAATFKDSPHPNAARLFLSWFLEKEQQSKLDTWSPRKDMAPPAGLPPLFSLKLANNYPAFMSDTKKVSDLRKRFEALTGPVQKKGGVR